MNLPTETLNRCVVRDREGRTTAVTNAAPKLVWSLDGDRVQLNDGKPMTGQQAINHVRRSWTNHGARVRTPGVLETWPLDSVDGTMTVSFWAGTLPIPDDVHQMVSDLILDLPLSIEQGDLFAKALEAAADSDCPDCPVCAPLRQLLATTVVSTPREGR